MKKENGVLTEVTDKDIKLLYRNPKKFWEGVTSIGSIAFAKCDSLVEINIPEVVTSIGDHAFEECRSLIKLNIPEGVTKIGRCAFKNCGSLTELNIPESVTNIRERTFEGCSSLMNINIPEGVTEIGDHAFSSCSSLTNINIPEGVTQIGEYAFSDCSSLTKINMPESVTKISDKAFSDCSSLTNINIPEGVTQIGNDAFKFCWSLIEINIPESVTEIGPGAFSGCSSLTNINIPEGVTEIGACAFFSCSRLTNINIPEGVTKIDEGAFHGCSRLTNINIPEGVTEIGAMAFYSCSRLTNINIPEGVTEIGKAAFMDCSRLTNINIPEGVTQIDKEFFSGCSSLTEINIPESVIYIFKGAFPEETILNIKTVNGLIVSKEYKEIKTLLDVLPATSVATVLTNVRFKKLSQKIGATEYNNPNFAELYKFVKTLGLLEPDTVTTEFNGKQIKVSDIAQELIQRIFNQKMVEYENMHRDFSDLNDTDFNLAFLNFMRDKTNCADLLAHPAMFAAFYSWFKSRTELEIDPNSTIQQEGNIPTIEANRFKVMEYKEMENGIYKEKWHAATFEAIQQEMALQNYTGITAETRPIAEELAKHSQYKEQKFFDKAVEIDAERKRLVAEGKLTDSLTQGVVKEDIVQAVERYKKETEELSDSILENCKNVVEDGADVGDYIFTYEMLPKSSVEIFSIGILTSCCAKLFGAGAGAQRATIIHPYLQPLVIRNSKGEIVAFSIIYVNREKGYIVANDVEVNRNYNGDKQTKSIYNAFKKGLEAFIEQYNSENEKHITVAKCGVSPNGPAINEYIKKNPEGNILQAVDFSEYQYAGTGRWAGDWQDHQYVIWGEEDREFEL